MVFMFSKKYIRKSTKFPGNPRQGIDLQHMQHCQNEEPARQVFFIIFFTKT